MTSPRLFALGAVLAMAAIAPAAAQDPREDAAFRQNCTGDYMRLCAMYDPDSPQVEQCFKAKMKEVSAQCRATIAAFRKAPEGRRR